MRIHSFESFGTVDGPGVRFVAFLQGCPLRCLYCHNPDTWSVNSDTVKMVTPAELMSEVLKYRSYIKSGGVTLSGGEPLLQAREAAEFFALCRVEGVHTALDTSGCIWNEDIERLLEVTDLVLLDIKSIDEKQYREITRTAELSATLRFLDELERRGVRCWIRHVVVPTLTDDDTLLHRLKALVERYSVVERVEILPYHDLALHKYESMGIEYPLKGVEPLSGARSAEIKQLFGEQ